MAQKIIRESIDTYCNMTTQTTLTKSVVIGGNPGEVKTFCMLYIALYIISKIFYSTSTESMCHFSLQMGTKHWHSILCLRGNKDNVINPYHFAELDVKRITRKLIV